MAFDGVCRLLSPVPRSFLCHIFRLLPIPGSTVPCRRRLEREAYHLGRQLITLKGRTLLSAIRECHGTYFSTGEQTYWPTDHHSLPDLLDFFVARGVTANYIQVEPVFELSSDHSPILATVGAYVLPRVVPPTLTTNHTDRDAFHAYITTHIDLHTRIKQLSELDDATHHFTTLLQDAA